MLSGGGSIVYHRVAHYLWLKGETYYFNRRVPKDIQPHYRCKRIIICLKTTRKDTALRSAKSLAQRLEDYWLSLRLAKIEIPALHLMHQHPINAASQTDISLKDALALYLRLKGSGKGASFHRAAERNIQSVIEVLGDRPLDGYASSDAASYSDFLLAKGLTTASVKRNFAIICSIIILSIQEHGLDCKNAFSKVYLPDLNDSNRRKPIPLEAIRTIQNECKEFDDEPRWLVALIADTGMRLSEAAGLHIDDIKVEGDIPYIDLKPHPWRSLKTKGSQRQVPLIGSSLWAAKRILGANAGQPYAFPRHTDGTSTNANSASAAINKWLKPRVPEGCVIHSFRHSLRDRLRATQCPSDMIDQIGGWSTAGVGQGYGEGYGIKVKMEWLVMMV